MGAGNWPEDNWLEWKIRSEFQLSQHDQLRLERILSLKEWSPVEIYRKRRLAESYSSPRRVTALKSFYQELSKREQTPQSLKQEQIPQSAKLSGWLVHILPEDWRSDLEELRHEWLSEGCSRWVVSLKTIKCLAEIVVAGIIIAWQNSTSATSNLDKLEKGDLMAVEKKPQQEKASVDFLLGILQAEISVANIKRVLEFMGERFGSKPIELTVEANGKKLEVKAKNRKELLAAIKAAEAFVASD
jgi:hypothetical protein